MYELKYHHIFNTFDLQSGRFIVLLVLMMTVMTYYAISTPHFLRSMLYLRSRVPIWIPFSLHGSPLVQALEVTDDRPTSEAISKSDPSVSLLLSSSGDHTLPSALADSVASTDLAATVSDLQDEASLYGGPREAFSAAIEGAMHLTQGESTEQTKVHSETTLRAVPQLDVTLPEAVALPEQARPEPLRYNVEAPTEIPPCQAPLIDAAPLGAPSSDGLVMGYVSSLAPSQLSEESVDECASESDTAASSVVPLHEETFSDAGDLLDVIAAASVPIPQAPRDTSLDISRALEHHITESPPHSDVDAFLMQSALLVQCDNASSEPDIDDEWTAIEPTVPHNAHMSSSTQLSVTLPEPAAPIEPTPHSDEMTASAVLLTQSEWTSSAEPPLTDWTSASNFYLGTDSALSAEVGRSFPTIPSLTESNLRPIIPPTTSDDLPSPLSASFENTQARTHTPDKPDWAVAPACEGEGEGETRRRRSSKVRRHSYEHPDWAAAPGSTKAKKKARKSEGAGAEEGRTPVARRGWASR